MTTANLQAVPVLKPSQRRIFDTLLEIGGDRPVAPEGLISELERTIIEGTATAMGRWTEPKLWLGKSQISSIRQCEGMTLAERAQPHVGGMHPATAVGIISHRAIQIAHTHPDRAVHTYVQEAVTGAHRETEFAAFWGNCDLSTQSDLVVSAVSRVTNFLDSFPPLLASWTPRFEEPVQARLGKLVLSARIDLVIGRPRAGGRQTMVLVDLKSGSLSDGTRHTDEASFYALVCALRHGVPPWRSTVLSLASGDWTDPDITPLRLMETAELVVDAANRYVDVLTEARPPELSAGRHCGWCPDKDACPAFAALQGDQVSAA